MNRTLPGDIQFSEGEIGLSQCVWCRHRADGGNRCRAFPDGIPDAILTNRHDHCHPYDGDRGVRFEPEIVEIEFVDVEPDDEPVSLRADSNTTFDPPAAPAATSEACETRGSDVSDEDAEEYVLDLGDVALG